ncbi:MAG: biotin--[acetyl-CoA-carboxylase] ligase, partial [Clostridia bacterium]|nr:biotin--[acetyl-CoA-carboxylase] ligase [Clostridia bacterium]
MADRIVSGTEDAFRRGLAAVWPEKVPLLSYEELGSTSTHARSLLESGRRPPFAVFAKRQTAGRGRRGKSFFSPAGGVYCTLALPDVPEPESSLVTLLAAVALRAAILSVCGKETGIKWVNDLYCGGKKVCGILSERLEGGILIGFGIDLAAQEYPEELVGIAGDLGCPDTDPALLAGACAGEILRRIARLPDHAFLAEYREYCFLPGREIVYSENGEKVRAVALGVE